MDISVRKACAQDYDACESIMQQVQQLHVGMRPDIYRPVEVAYPREEFDENVARGMLYVAETADGVCGILQMLLRRVRSPHQCERSVLFIETMAVDEAHRGQGIGHRLIDRAKALQSEMGLDGLELQVNARNLRALKMYEDCGFTFKSINMELL